MEESSDEPSRAEPMTPVAHPQHTPEPWRVRGCELIGDGTILATLCWHSGREVENAADYALMAAAPRLLTALQTIAAGPMFAVTDVQKWAEWVQELAAEAIADAAPRSIPTP